MNISLIGYRGTGKSTVGKLLAEQMGFTLRSLDVMIVEKAKKGIPELVAGFGWDHFRDLESQVLAEVVKTDRQVLDCGGGIILREENRKLLRAAGPVFWLTATVETIIARIQDDTQRPSLTGKSFTEEVEEVLATREPLYRQAANYIVATDHRTPEDIAQEIICLLRDKDHTLP